MWPPRLDFSDEFGSDSDVLTHGMCQLLEALPNSVN